MCSNCQFLSYRHQSSTHFFLWCFVPLNLNSSIEVNSTQLLASSQTLMLTLTVNKPLRLWSKWNLCIFQEDDRGNNFLLQQGHMVHLHHLDSHKIRINWTVRRMDADWPVCRREEYWSSHRSITSPGSLYTAVSPAMYKQHIKLLFIQ